MGLSSLSWPTVPCVRGDRPGAFKGFSVHVLTLILTCVHLHFMEEHKPNSWELQQEDSLPLWPWLEGLELAMTQRPRREGWEVSGQWIALLRGKNRLFIPLSWACWLSGSPDSAHE